jgi:uncharacterized membrane protein
VQLTAPVGLLLAVAALGSAVVAGAFLVFSVLVVPALAALPGAEGSRAMQSVNRVAVRPVFMTLLFGTGAVCLVVGVQALVDGSHPAVVAATVVYLLGVLGVTIAGNVPLNDALARTAPGAEPPGGWLRWLRRWTAWNTGRSLAALAAAALFGAVLAGRLS